MGCGATLREANDDLARSTDFLDRHLLEIAEWIFRLAQATDCAAVPEREVIRTHASMACPADQAGDDPVFALRLQHGLTVQKVGL